MTEYISLGSNCSMTYQLNKYGLRLRAYPFDWVKINLSQLNQILEKDFNDFVESIELKKISQKHEYFGNSKIEDIDEFLNQSHNTNDNSIIDNYKIDKEKSDSVILTNKYHIEFAHELADPNQIEYFKSRIESRIDRFRNIQSICKSKQICFIRIELNPIKSIWIENIQNLIRLLKKYINDFKLILIINSESICQEYFPDFVKIYKYKYYSPDWKMDDLDWNNIFNL